MRNRNSDSLNTRNNESSNTRIQELTKEIARLSIELGQVVSNKYQESNPSPISTPERVVPPQTTATAQETHSIEFQEGDRVVIKNNYRGQRGLTGTIISVTRVQVCMKLDISSKIINKKKTNILHIQ